MVAMVLILSPRRLQGPDLHPCIPVPSVWRCPGSGIRVRTETVNEVMGVKAVEKYLRE